MRPYRGLTKDGKMVHGSHCEVESKHYIIPDDAEMTYFDGYVNEKLITGCVEVIPETVGQSTGFKAKNDTEVYAGDIIDVHPDGTRRYLRTVEWNDELSQFQALFSDGSGLQLFTKQQCLTYEVAGNIHQHPELLGK